MARRVPVESCINSAVHPVPLRTGESYRIQKPRRQACGALTSRINTMCLERHVVHSADFRRKCRTEIIESVIGRRSLAAATLL